MDKLKNQYVVKLDKGLFFLTRAAKQQYMSLPLWLYSRLGINNVTVDHKVRQLLLLIPSWHYECKMYDLNESPRLGIER